jgi:LPP20 lipoprotein
MRDSRISQSWGGLAATASAALIALAVTGCGSKPKDVVTECAYPDVPGAAAPLWICDAPVEGVAVGAMGSHEKSGAGVAFSRDQAVASARFRLAQNMRTYVTGMIDQFAATTGSVGQETVDRTHSSVTKQVTEETITGSKVFRSATSPKGTFYVYVGMDETVAKAAAQKAIKSSMDNDQALWQQWRAGKAKEELAAEIAKMK